MDAGELCPFFLCFLRAETRLAPSNREGGGHGENCHWLPLQLVLVLESGWLGTSKKDLLPEWSSAADNSR